MLLPRSLFKLHKELWRSCQLRQVHTTPNPLLAGHSKWANIKHIKAQKDGERAAQFTRLSRMIRIAVQEGGSVNPALNSQLRTVVDEAVRKNMPMASIQNNLKKCQTNKLELKKYQLNLRYKQKVFAIAVLYTDNFVGLKMDIAPILRKSGATYVDVSHMFEDFGLIEATLDQHLLKQGPCLEERATDDAIECGAEEVEIINAANGAVNFICRPIEINAIRKALEGKGYIIENSDHIYTAKNLVRLSEDELKAYEIFVKKLRDMPGLEDIYDNVEYDESN